MQLIKKILLIALSISFYEISTMKRELTNISPNVSGSVQTKHYEPEGIMISQATNLIIKFASIDNDLTHMSEVGTWLTQQRNYFVEGRAWTTLVDNLINKINARYYLCTSIENKKLTNITNIVKYVAYKLKPGENCAQLLLEHMGQEMAANTAVI